MATCVEGVVQHLHFQVFIHVLNLEFPTCGTRRSSRWYARRV